MAVEFSKSGRHVRMNNFEPPINTYCRETMKRVLAFPPETKVEWKSHDSSIQQRTAIDDARKEKTNNSNHHSSDKRTGGKEEYTGDRK
jgi:translation initiation factor 4E